MKMSFVGIILIAVFALIGYGIGMLKVPNIGVLKDTQAVGGENLDDVIKRAILFKRKGNKIYVYDNKEVETNDKWNFNSLYYTTESQKCKRKRKDL